MVSDGGCIVSLSVRRVSTSLPADLVFGLHEFLLNESAVLGIRLYGVCVQELHECCYDLLIDLVEFMRCLGVRIIKAGLRYRACWNWLGGCGICRSVVGRRRRRR